MQDVVTEMEIKKVLDKVTFPIEEQKLWEIQLKSFIEIFLSI